MAGYWKFNEGSGTSTIDSSGNNNAATLIGGTTWATLSSGEKVLSFDGVDDSVNCGNITAIPQNGPATIIGWFSFDQFANTKVGYNNLHTQLFQHSANNYLYLGGGGANFFNTTAKISQTSTWYNIALTYNNTHESALLYVNGIRVNVVIQVPNINYASLTPFRISNASFDGYIDGVRVYNRIILVDEIAKIYNQEKVRYGL